MRTLFSRLRLGLPAVLTLLAACWWTPVGPVPPGVAPTDYGAMQYWAAENLKCPRDKLTHETFGKGRHLFKGCDQQVEMLVLEPGSPPIVQRAAADRFAKEVKCDIRTTDEERIDEKTHVVEGCGQRITYVHACTPQCSWIANMSSDKH